MNQENFRHQKLHTSIYVPPKEQYQIYWKRDNQKNNEWRDTNQRRHEIGYKQHPDFGRDNDVGIGRDHALAGELRKRTRRMELSASPSALRVTEPAQGLFYIAEGEAEPLTQN